MKLGIMQPYFMPYIGYWQLIKAVDKYVVYDDVNYIKGGWISRNNILMNGEKKMFTIILKGASPNKLINEIEIGDNFQKFMKTLHGNYARAPHYKEVEFLMQTICSYSDKSLGKFLFNSIVEVCRYLHIDTEILLSSEIKKNNDLRGKDKVMHICKILGASEYYNTIAGDSLYDKVEFQNQGIKLSFLKPGLQSYAQFKNDFVPGLSIIDILMFNSVDEVNRLLDDFILC